MATHCAKCGAEIPEGWDTCRACFAPVKHEGLLARLRRWFGGVRLVVSSSPPAHGSPGVSIKLTAHVKIRDAKTGEVHEYHSLDDVPADYREKIRQARAAAVTGAGGQTITVTDAAGKVQTYRSLDEMPPDLRALYEKTRGL